MTRRIKMEKHHTSLLLYSHLTRRVINAFQEGGWDRVDELMRRSLRKYFLPLRVRAARAQLQSHRRKNVRVVPVTPKVKSRKTRKLS